MRAFLARLVERPSGCKPLSLVDRAAPSVHGPTATGGGCHDAARMADKSAANQRADRRCHEARSCVATIPLVETTMDSARPVNRSDENEVALEVLEALIVKR